MASAKRIEFFYQFDVDRSAADLRVAAMYEHRIDDRLEFGLIDADGVRCFIVSGADEWRRNIV